MNKQNIIIDKDYNKQYESSDLTTQIKSRKKNEIYSIKRRNRRVFSFHQAMAGGIVGGMVGYASSVVVDMVSGNDFISSFFSVDALVNAGIGAAVGVGIAAVLNLFKIAKSQRSKYQTNLANWEKIYEFNIQRRKAILDKLDKENPHHQRLRKILTDVVDPMFLTLPSKELTKTFGKDKDSKYKIVTKNKNEAGYVRFIMTDHPECLHTDHVEKHKWLGLTYQQLKKIKKDKLETGEWKAEQERINALNPNQLTTQIVNDYHKLGLITSSVKRAWTKQIKNKPCSLVNAEPILIYKQNKETKEWELEREIPAFSQIQTTSKRQLLKNAQNEDLFVQTNEGLKVSSNFVTKEHNSTNELKDFNETFLFDQYGYPISTPIATPPNDIAKAPETNQVYARPTDTYNTYPKPAVHILNNQNQQQKLNKQNQNQKTQDKNFTQTPKQEAQLNHQKTQQHKHQQNQDYDYENNVAVDNNQNQTQQKHNFSTQIKTKPNVKNTPAVELNECKTNELLDQHGYPITNPTLQKPLQTNHLNTQEIVDHNTLASACLITPELQKMLDTTINKQMKIRRAYNINDYESENLTKQKQQIRQTKEVEYNNNYNYNKTITTQNQQQLQQQPTIKPIPEDFDTSALFDEHGYPITNPTLQKPRQTSNYTKSPEPVCDRFNPEYLSTPTKQIPPTPKPITPYTKKIKRRY